MYRYHPYAGAPWQGRPLAAPSYPRGPYSAPSAYAPHALPRPTAYPIPVNSAAPRFGVLPRPYVPAVVPQSPALAQPPVPVTVAASDAPNPKSKLNEWFMKAGHLAQYITVPVEGGFSSSLTLPLDGLSEAATCTGFASSKKAAEQQCADQAMQTLLAFGLLDILTQPSKNKSKGKKNPAPSVAGHPAAAPPTPGAVPVQGWTNPAATSADFEALKQMVYQLVQNHPGRRTTTYMMMCPAGNNRKKVTAALYQLAEQGVVVKTVPTSGKNMVPFWSPLGYDGPLGGGVKDEEVGEGRSLPLSEVKMVCYDVLVGTTGLSAHEVFALTRSMGHPWEVKTINAALYSMEKDGNAEATLEGAVKKWHVK
jgi:hypothetical protein